MLRWFRNRRRRRLLEEKFPAEWLEVLAELPFFGLLSPAEQEQLQRDVRIFVAEKNWEGVHGLELTDAMRVRIAAHACYLILALGLACYDRVMSILVYPDSYSVPQQVPISGGGMIEGRSHRLGEAWYRGPIILSWPDVLAAGKGGDRASNLVYHEFAHKLDMLNGRGADGIPVIESPELARRWEPVMSRAYDRLCGDCRHGRPTLLDCYGTQDRGEFFAVATEAFFQQPIRLQRRDADLYDILAAFYQQDPAARILRRSTPQDPLA
jgi:Mlc titration factor MtfA (ptsG expression regulator)